MPKRLLLASNSTNSNYNEGYLDYCADEIDDFLGSVRRVLLVPYALRDHDLFLKRARYRFGLMGREVESIHLAADPAQAIRDAEALFIGGGNTHRLLNRLYQLHLLPSIREKIEAGSPYIGSSAGSILCGLNIKTTNDMPIVDPPSLDALGILPFDVNPHYVDPLPLELYHGESRELRLTEFLEENDTVVVALREGAMLRIEWPSVILKGPGGARIFRRGADPLELRPGAALDELLTAPATTPA
jgi:dipeptidase E